MGRITYLIVFFGLIGLIAAIVPQEENNHPSSLLDVTISPNNSVSLKKHHIFICKGHFFEWCREESVCGYCQEPLEKVNLWEYYKLLECEDCQKYFEDNYPLFIETNNTQ
jgi:hypothetical protein